jgi:23S rRNA pseudouridine1911/1915/1917 synthase
VNQPLWILYEDDHCLAVSKPAGQFPLGRWSPPGDTTLEWAIRSYLDPANPGGVYLGIVHRLDRPTSGVLIWTKTPKAARRLSRQFETRRALKEYWAVVELKPNDAKAGRHTQSSSAPQGPLSRETWVDSLTRPDRTGMVRTVPRQTAGAREAITQVAVGAAVQMPEGCTWLRLWPRTGRTHQLRVQTAARGMPILGDSVYGSDRPFEPAHAIALHAYRLRVLHPISGTELDLTAPLPEEWAAQGIILPETGEAETSR